MAERTAHSRFIAGAAVIRRKGSPHSIRRACTSFASLILLGAFGIPGPSVAQDSAVPGRLTVRPHEMATGTRNAQAGVQTLDSLEDHLVYVPSQAVGTKRMPLVVVLHGGGGSSREQLQRHKKLADQYGLILLLPNAVIPGRWDLINGFATNQLTIDSTVAPFFVREMPQAPDVHNIDAAMKQVLRKYAIDPDKIALVGMSDGGAYSLFLGRTNLDIFSRVAPMSPGIPFDGAGPQDTTTQFFFLSGIAEAGFYLSALTAGQKLKQEGYPVKQALILRPHQQRPEDYSVMFRWVHDSWASPDNDSAAAPSRVFTIDSIPVLDLDALIQLTLFWTSFMQEPDSIRITGRQVHQQQVMVPIGDIQMSLMMMDTPAMAARYPGVAADLEAAGLTAEQADAYRLAFICTRATELAVSNSVPGVKLEPTIVKNVEFFKANSEQLQALGKTGMWTTP